MPGEHAIRPFQNINYRTMSISLLQPLLFFCERPTYGVSSPRLFTSLIREAEELRRRKQNYNE